MLRWCLVPLLAFAPLAARAEDQVALGWGRLFNNDALADMQDRWHTGSYSISQVRGLNWRGSLPTRKSRSRGRSLPRPTLPIPLRTTAAMPGL